MNYLMAKIKRKESPVKVLSQTQGIFETPPAFSKRVRFDTNYKLESDECFVIEGFMDLGFENPFVTATPFSSTSYSSIESNSYNQIQYLCAVQGTSRFFQKMGTRQFASKRFLQISEEPKIHTLENAIVMSEVVDAIYEMDKDNLLFTKLAKLNGIFKNINNFRKEATQEEVDDFLQLPFVDVDSAFATSKVGYVNRRHIPAAQEKWDILSPEEQNDMINYIKTSSGLPCLGNAFSVSSDSDVRKLVWGILERYFETQVTHKKMLANSVLEQ